jgi:hypothetical protein
MNKLVNRLAVEQDRLANVVQWDDAEVENKYQEYMEAISSGELSERQRAELTDIMEPRLRFEKQWREVGSAGIIASVRADRELLGQATGLDMDDLLVDEIAELSN